MSGLRETTRPQFIILGRGPTDNALRGVLEHSFSMDISKERVRVWWSGKATDNIFGNKWIVDGLKDAEHNMTIMAKSHPDMEFTVYDAWDDDLPVTLDWDEWEKDCGYRSKFGSRNIKFELV